MIERLPWLQRDELDPMARAFAHTAWRANVDPIGSQRAATLAALCALLVVQRSGGHGAIHPDDWSSVREHPDLGGVVLPDATAWEHALAASPWVGDGSQPTPLVRRGDGSLALYRDDRAEIELSRRLRALAADVDDTPPTPDRVETFGRLFTLREPTGPALAAAAALRSRLTVVTGGPGTGKTTTVIRVLALLLSADPSLRVAVAAPTGKAAARLGESFADQRAGLPVSDRVRAALDLPVATVHRLLRARPHDGSFGHDARHPLPHDVVVVDEASMLDLGLARALVDALPPRARLILLGDPDQLASVDAGAVLADLVAARTTRGDVRTPGFAAFARPFFESEIETSADVDVFADATVELRVNHRFDAQPAIAQLAEALRAGEPDHVLEVLDTAAFDEVRRVEPGETADTLDPVLDDWLRHVPGPDDGDDLQRLRRVESGVRLLTALRRGPWGVEGLNARVERRLRRRDEGAWDTADTWYRGRPVMIRRNVPALGVSNGDIGVCAPDPAHDGAPSLLLRDSEGALRRLAVARLPEHETAWAMTVHKAQGSEADHVLLVLPRDRHPLLTRSLLYTGVTRARRSVTVVGSVETLRAAVLAREQRRTALRDRLREDPGA